VLLDASEQAHTSFLAKPFTGASLLDAVTQLLPTTRR